MAKIDTLFMTKTAKKTFSWGRTHLYSPYKGVPAGLHAGCNTLLVNALNRVFKCNLSLSICKWLLTNLELSWVRNIILRSQKLNVSKIDTPL